MNKRIMSFALCICLVLTILHSYNMSFFAMALECTCGTDTEEHAVNCATNCNCGTETTEHSKTCIVNCTCEMPEGVHLQSCAINCTCTPTDGVHAITCAINCDCTMPEGEHLQSCIVNCNCGTEDSAVHKPYCEIYCNCDSASHTEESCPAFNCVEKNGCTLNNDNTITHLNTCRKYTHSCAKLEGCDTTSDNEEEHTHARGCPLLEGDFCYYCGWLFGEHYQYCQSNTNKPNLPAEIVVPEALKQVTSDSDYAGAATILAKYSSDEYTDYIIYYLSENMTTLDPATLKDVFIPEGKKVIIDLNGYTFRGTGHGSAITNYGTLVIEDTRPTVEYVGVLKDRGYYFHDDESGIYYHSTRNATKVIWDQDNVDESLTDAEKVFIYGGIIYGGLSNRNVSDYQTRTKGYTFEELIESQNAAFGDPKREYFTYLYELKNYSTYGRGGAGIYNTGTLIMNGGTIAGCESMQGEGAAVYSTGEGASFTMNGGSIAYNYGNSIVANEDKASFTMNSGILYHNVGVGNGAIRGYTKDNAQTLTTVTIGKDGSNYDEAILKELADVKATSYPAANTNYVTTAEDGTRELLNTKLIYYTYYYNNVENTLPDFPIIDHNIALAGIATDGNGGGIYAENINFIVDVGIFSNNWAHYRGGGIDIFSKGDVTFSGNVLIRDNYCEYKGGGISVRAVNYDSEKPIKAAIKNKTDVETGGGNDTENGIETVSETISNTVRIIGNKAAYGGGIHVSNGNFDMSAGDVLQNESLSYYVSTTNYNYLTSKDAKTTNEYKTDQVINFNGSENPVTLDDSDRPFTSNNTPCSRTHGGGGIYIEGSEVDVTVSGTALIDGNEAKHRGAGLYLSAGTVTMSGGTISNNTIINNVYDADGGGVYINAGQFVMHDGEICNNYVDAVQGDAGGVFVSAPSREDYAFIMNGGSIHDNENRDDQGGGLLVNGKMQMNAGSIYNNISNDNGGGIYVEGTFDMTGGEIYSNTANTYIGGGVYVNKGNFTMSAGKIYKNKTLMRNGGGVYVRDGNFTMTGGEISQNTANCTNKTFTGGGLNKGNHSEIGTQYGSGGGICIENGNVSITGKCEIKNNQAAFKGGAIYMFRDSDESANTLVIGAENGDDEYQPQIHDNSLSCNFQAHYNLGGGAICIEGADSELIINSGKIYSNTTSGVEGADRIVGGAIFVLDDTQNKNNTSPALRGKAKVTINGGEIYSNRSIEDQGGAMYIYGDGDVIINDGDIYNNLSNANGGFAYLSGGDLTINGGKIHNNKSQAWIGGAFCLSTGNVYMYGGDIYSNETQSNASGASYSLGGAFYITSGSFYMYDGIIRENKTGTYGSGGAVYMQGSGSFNMYGGTLSGNKAGTQTIADGSRGNGGAVYVNGGSINIGKNGCDGLAENSVHNDLEPKKSQCGHPVIEGNSAVNGGALYSLKSTINFYCGEMTANTASNKGGGMYVGSANANITIVKGTVKGNKANKETYGDALYMTAGTVTYTDTETFKNIDGSSTGVVIAGGNLLNTNKTDYTDLTSVYFKDRDTKQNYKEFTVPNGTYIVLPEGADIFGKYTNQTFIGWQYPKVGDYVRKDADYLVEGTQILVEPNSDDDSYEMTIYGVWAHTDNSITYYQTNAETNTYSGGDYTTSYTYQTATDNIFTLPTPTLPGYTFMGWALHQGISCKQNCNANWDISADLEETYDNLYPAGKTFNTKSKFGNIHFVANWSATITYVAGENGSISNDSENITIGQITTQAVGSTATADENYIFVGWYTTADCSGTPVSTECEFVPQINDATGYYDALTYYAKFELQYTNLTINTTGADSDQTFVFTVSGTTKHGSEAVNMQVFVFGGNSSVTIEHIPTGTYNVYENNCDQDQGDTWTWRYTNTEKITVEVDGVNDTATFTYATKLNIVYWLNGFSEKLYKLLTGN